MGKSGRDMLAALVAGVVMGFRVLTLQSEQWAPDRAGLAGSSQDKGHETTPPVAPALTLRYVEA